VGSDINLYSQQKTPPSGDECTKCEYILSRDKSIKAMMVFAAHVNLGIISKL